MKVRSTSRVLLFFLLVCSAILAPGCGRRRGDYITADRLEKGLVVVLHGIEGPSYLNKEICRGLYMGGVECAVKNYKWASVWGVWHNLNAEQDNRRKARELARWIAGYREGFPGRPVFIVGHSGGGAIGLWAVEAMAGDEPIDGLILLNAALSENYDLGPALDKTRRGIVNIHSKLDWLLLGIGTRIAGTMDRRHGESAGKDGFAVPDDDPRYRKLFQIGWSRDMLVSGHWGGHLSSAASHFVAMYIAPLIFAPSWNEEVVENVGAGRGSNPPPAPPR